MLKRHISIILPIIASMLFGCTTNKHDNPYLADKYDYPKSIITADTPNEEDKHRMLVATYFNKYLLEYETQQKLDAFATNSPVVSHWSSAMKGTQAQMFTDLATGTFNSGIGEQVGATVLIADLTLGAIFDGAADETSGAWLPKKYNGDTLDSKEKALTALNQITKQRLQAIADKLGWKMECVWTCEAADRYYFYRFTNPDGNELNTGYIYRPSEFIAKISIGPLEKLEENNIYSALLYENISWKTEGKHRFRVSFHSEYPVSEDDKLVSIRDSDNKSRFYAKRDLVHTQFGHDLLKTFHGTKYTTFGTKVTRQNTVFYNGRNYVFSSDSEVNLATREKGYPYLLNKTSKLSNNSDIDIVPVQPGSYLFGGKLD
jgi:hypothetical protein